MSREVSSAADVFTGATRCWLERIGFALVLVYVLLLAGSAVRGLWLIDGDGRVIANDFVNVWAAGELALHGGAGAAYDWTIIARPKWQLLDMSSPAITAGIIHRHFCS
jgi:arabinofuranan 3-O-arabinosyltransferase